MTEFKRCRPLLGTFVEVSVSGAPDRVLRQAVCRAFESIEAISASMSFHDPKSELSRLNHAPVGEWTQISAPLAEILSLSLDLQEKSSGRFNVAIAETLVSWGLLPGANVRTGWRNLSMPGFELEGRTCRRVLPVQIDLGGIAKGYAVDRAVESIERVSASLTGVVNAGGDIRAFGRREFPVWVRGGRPENPILRKTVLRQQALATSSVIPRVQPGRSRRVSPYVDIHGRCALQTQQTAAVRASRCVIADALTKVALLLPRRQARRIIAEYGAEMSICQ